MPNFLNYARIILSLLCFGSISASTKTILNV